MKNKIFEKSLNCETKIEKKSSTNIKKETKNIFKKVTNLPKYKIFKISKNLPWNTFWFLQGNALKLEKQLFNGCPPHINWIKS